jgi:hypothetical protein
VKLTKQGVRDLNPPGHTNPRKPPRVVPRCPHIWEPKVGRDCWLGFRYYFDECLLCHEVRS